MNIDNFLTLLFTIAITLYLFRGFFNWILLNQVNGTNHPRIFNSKQIDLILTTRHLAISFLKGWWKGDEFRTLKLISNFISGLLYLTILALVFTIFIGYKL